MTDPRYFCIGENNESLYHTIDSSFRPIRNPNQSNVPPLPLRLFSVSSKSEDEPPHKWTSSPPQSKDLPGPSCLEVQIHGCIKPLEQHYEIPMSLKQISRDLPPEPIGREYESEIEDFFNEDNLVRVNPLYSTSEDEI